MSRPGVPWSHLRPARLALAVAVVASVIAGCAVVAQAFAVGALVVGAVEGAPLAGASTWLLAVTAVRLSCGAVVEVATSRAAGQVAGSLRHRVLGAVLAAPGGRRTTGALAVLLTRGVAATEPWFTRYVPAVLLAGILPLITLLALTALDPWSGLIVASTLPLIPLFAALVGLATRDRARTQWALMESLSGHFVDVLRGLPTLVVHRRAARQGDVVRAVTDRYRSASAETLRLAFASTVVLELIATLSVALVAVCVGLRLAAGGLDFRTALVVLLLAPEAYWPLRRVGAEFHAAAEGGAALEAADRAIAHDVRRAGITVGRTGSTIAMRNADLGHDGRRVLAGVDVDLGPGLTAITGPSGCGKSTLLSALVGELAPLSGQLVLDGVDREVADLGQWRRRVAYAPQQPWLIEGSVADNVRIGRPGATDPEVWSALERAGLAHLVLTLEGGLDARLRQDGAGLSAGERARLVLARIVLADREVVVLDEPTAHLDAETEAIVLHAVRALAADRTVVVVAHRPTVAAAADRVLDLSAWAVHEQPTVPATSPVVSAVQPDRSAQDDAMPDGGWRAAALGSLAAGSGIALTATAGWLITMASTHPPVLTLMVAIVAVRTFGIARPVLGYVERLESHDRALRLLARRRADVYGHLVPLVPGRIDLRRGDALATITEDVEVVVDERVRVRQPLLVGAVVSVSTVALSALVLPAAAVALAALSLFAATVTVSVAHLVGRSERGLVAARGLLAERVERTLTGGRNLVLWQREGAALVAVDEAGESLSGAAHRSARGRASGRALLVAAVGATCVAIAHLASGAVPGPSVALLVLVPLALGEVLVPLVDAGALAGRCSAARRRLKDLADLPPAVTGPTSPTSVPRPRTDAPDLLLRGAGVPGYPVSLRIPPGGRVGLTGPSGSGKSTAAGQLLRFTDPPGSVSLDGVPLPRMALDDVRSRVTLVDDDPYLFATSVVENVRLARPEATDADVRRALEGARLSDWLAHLPHGLHTLIGEGHRGVSGGERARLGVARALVSANPVVVLDEPTAHLDADTAARLTSDLLAAIPGRSLLWIGHTDVPAEELDVVVDLTSRASTESA